MVYAFILHTLSTGPCRVLFSSVFVHETQSETEAIEGVREKRKEQLLQVASRVQSEFSFKFVASGSVQDVDTTGLATTDELISQLESGMFRISAGNPFELERIVVWKGLSNCGFTLICERTENRVLAENVLSLIIRYLQEYCRVLSQPTEAAALGFTQSLMFLGEDQKDHRLWEQEYVPMAILKADKMTAIIFQILPNGQLLFMNHRFVRQLEKELEQIMAMK